MQLWSQTDVSFVDFADGYSHLAFMPINFGMKPNELKPEDISTVLHEFTHQLALKGPFGWLCAYFQALRPIARVFSELQSRIEFPELFDHVNQDRDWGLYISLETFYEVYGDCLANYYDLIDAYRWLLEGIALFVQFDFDLSREFDVASEIFHFAAELVKTEQFRIEGTLNLADVFSFVDRARESKKQSGLLQIFLENTNPETASYFMGYLMLKQIQRILASKDARLKDTELFFILIQGYFFRDRKVIELSGVCPRQIYQQTVREFIWQSVSDLLSTDNTRISQLVDSIVNFDNSPVHPDLLDFAHLLREGSFSRWVDVDVVLELDRELTRYAEELEQSKIFIGYREHDRFRELVDTSVEVAKFLFHTLRNIMLTFKMKHIHRAILGYQLSDDENVLVTSIGVNGTPISLMESMPLAEFIPIMREAEQHQYEIARDEGPRMPQPIYMAFTSGNWSEFVEILWDYYQQGKLLIVQDYDVYLMMGKERCRIQVRGDYLHVEPYHWQANANPNQITSEEDCQMLRSVGGYFHHREYLAHLQVPQIIGGPTVRQDKEFERETLQQMWKLVYPTCSATAKELDSFAEQKVKIIAVTKFERCVLKSMYSMLEEHTEATIGAINAINRRWKHFTDRDLLITHGGENSISAELDL
jgi:hypothetical protein